MNGWWPHLGVQSVPIVLPWSPGRDPPPPHTHTGMAATLQRFLQSDNLPKGAASDTLLLHNRTASKAAALVQELGAGKSIPSPAELGQQATIICLMLIICS